MKSRVGIKLKSSSCRRSLLTRLSCSLSSAIFVCISVALFMFIIVFSIKDMADPMPDTISVDVGSASCRKTCSLAARNASSSLGKMQMHSMMESVPFPSSSAASNTKQGIYKKVMQVSVTHHNVVVRGTTLGVALLKDSQLIYFIKVIQ